MSTACATDRRRVRAGRRQDGTTLVELLVALFLISLGLLAVAPMFVFAVQGNAIGADLNQACARAAARMELLRSLDFKAPELELGGSLDSDKTDHGQPYFDQSDPDYLLRWRVAKHATLADTKELSVRTIARNPSVGRPKQVTLVTIRGKG